MMAETILAESARYMAQARGDAIAAGLIASKAGARSDARKHLELKAAVAAGKVGSSDFGALAESATSEFLHAARPMSVALRLFASGVHPVPTATRAVVVIADATASALGEGAPIPVSKIALAERELEPRKAVSLVVVSAELLRATSTAAKRLIDRSLQSGVAAALDRAVIAIATDGVAPISSTGPTAGAAMADIRTMLGTVNVTGSGSLAWLAAPDVANAAATLAGDGGLIFPKMSPTGGELLNLPAFVSEAIPAGTLILLDAASLGGEVGSVEIDLAEHASVELDSAPTNPPTSSTVMRSLWQQNQVALRATANFALEKLRADGVAVLDGVAWGAP